MWHAITAFVLLSLLALWSLLAWALHAGVDWAASNADRVSAGASAMLTLRVPGSWTEWMPADLVQALDGALRGLLPVAESLLQLVPSLAGVLSVAIVVVWAFGGLLVLMLGAVLHGLIAVWSRRAAAQRPPIAAVIRLG